MRGRHCRHRRGGCARKRCRLAWRFGIFDWSATRVLLVFVTIVRPVCWRCCQKRGRLAWRFATAKGRRQRKYRAAEGATASRTSADGGLSEPAWDSDSWGGGRAGAGDSFAAGRQVTPRRFDRRASLTFGVLSGASDPGVVSSRVGGDRRIAETPKRRGAKARGNGAYPIMGRFSPPGEPKLWRGRRGFFLPSR